MKSLRYSLTGLTALGLLCVAVACDGGHPVAEDPSGDGDGNYPPAGDGDGQASGGRLNGDGDLGGGGGEILGDGDGDSGGFGGIGGAGQVASQN